MNLDRQADYQGWQAHVTWSAEKDPAGSWYLYVADKHGESSDLVATWESAPRPPTLLERYDALAVLGFAVVEGGVEAWKWREAAGDDGENYFMGTADIRPLRVHELPAEDPPSITL